VDNLGEQIMAAKKARKPAAAKQNTAGDLEQKQQPDSGGAGRTDVTGVVPDNVHVDPNITEGHPGYDESGSSEIIPPDRLKAGEGS